MKYLKLIILLSIIFSISYATNDNNNLNYMYIYNLEQWNAKLNCYETEYNVQTLLISSIALFSSIFTFFQFAKYKYKDIAIFILSVIFVLSAQLILNIVYENDKAFIKQVIKGYKDKIENFKNAYMDKTTLNELDISDLHFFVEKTRSELKDIEGDLLCDDKIIFSIYYNKLFANDSYNRNIPLEIEIEHKSGRIINLEEEAEKIAKKELIDTILNNSNFHLELNPSQKEKFFNELKYFIKIQHKMIPSRREFEINTKAYIRESEFENFMKYFNKKLEILKDIKNNDVKIIYETSKENKNIKKNIKGEKNYIQVDDKISQYDSKPIVNSSNVDNYEINNKIKNNKIGYSSTSSSTSSNGAELFRKCAACHGINAEKHALGKSEIIARWDVSKTIEALKGYKNGTYGGAMKGVMKGQVAGLSDTDIDVLAKYISNFELN